MSSERSAAEFPPILVSPDHLPLDIECDANNLAAVIRTVLECQDHVECQQSPFKVEFVGVDHSDPDQTGQALFSTDNIPDRFINPAPTPFNSRNRIVNPGMSTGTGFGKSIIDTDEFKQAQSDLRNLHDDMLDRLCGNQQPQPPFSPEQRLDWITDQLNEWYGSHAVGLSDNLLNRLILKVDDMIGSGQWAPVNVGVCIERDQAKVQLQREREANDGLSRRLSHATKLLEEAGYSYDAISNMWTYPAAKQPDPTEQLAQEYEKREILDNASAVGYMRERIRELEAEKNQLAQMHNQASGERDRFRALNSNQKADIDKWFDIMTTWGWDDGEPHEWLTTYVETIVNNCATLNDRNNNQTSTIVGLSDDYDRLEGRYKMLSGELDQAIRIKNDLFESNKTLNAERSELVMKLNQVTDSRDRYQDAANQIALDLAKKEKGYDRLNAKYQKLRESIKR